MFLITWKDDNGSRPPLKVKDKRAVENEATGYGSQGAVVIWTTDFSGVINYYNTTIAYVTLYDQPEEKKEPTAEEVVLRITLQDYEKDDLVILLEKYNKFIQKDWLSGGNGPMDLLTYIATVFQEEYK